MSVAHTRVTRTAWRTAKRGRGNSTGWTGDARSELIWVVSGDSGDIGRGIAITAINLIRTNEHS